MSAGDDDKRDRLAADRLKALGRHDLVSADGKLWWNGGKWEPIGLSLNYEVSSAEEMSPGRHRHGIERFLFLNLPSKEELQKPLPDPEAAEQWANKMAQISEQQSRQLAQKPAPTLQEGERLMEAERRQRMRQEANRPAEKGGKGLVTYVTNRHSGKTYTVSTVRMFRRFPTISGEPKTLTLGESRIYQAGPSRLQFLMARVLLRQLYLERDLLDGGGLAQGPTVALEELHARVVRMVRLDDPDRWKMPVREQMAWAEIEFPPFVSHSRQRDEFRARDEQRQ